MPRSLPIAVLLSGTGRTLANLLDRIAAGKLDAELRLVVSSKPGVRGLEIAQAAGVPTRIVERKNFADAESFGEAVFAPCRECGAELVVMAGFLQLAPVPADFENRVINIHPALIPSFSGQGYYGHRVHEAVLAAGMTESGCTVHFVDNEYDHGPIILQKIVPVEPDDTPDSLAARVFEAECEALPEAIQSIAVTRQKA